MEDNDPISEETLNKETENLESWKDALEKEVRNIIEQSEKHAAEEESHKADQTMDLNEKNAHTSEETKNIYDVPQSDSSQSTKDSAEFSKVHVVHEQGKSDDPKADERLDSEKGNEEVKSEQLDHKNSEAAEKQLSEEEVKGTPTNAGQQKDKKKPKSKKGQKHKKTIEQEEMDEWGSGDDFGDVVDEPFDEDLGDDIEGGDDMEDFSEEADSIDSWKISEKPLDEAEDFGDEEVDDKLKEQEDLQEEIKQLKGFISTFFLLHVKIYLLLTEFEVRTVSYDLSFFPIDLWPKRSMD